MYVPIYLLVCFLICISLYLIIEYIINKSTEMIKYKITTYEVLATIAHLYSSKMRDDGVPPTAIEVSTHLRSTGVNIPISVIESLLKDIHQDKSDTKKEVEVGPVLYNTIYDLQKKLYLTLRISYLVFSVGLLVILTIVAKY